MRGPLPLNDADFAAIRASVRARIERPRRAFGWYLAFAASVVVAVLSAVVARQPVARPADGVRASRPHPATVSVAGITAAPHVSPHPKQQRRETRRWSGREARTPVVAVARIEFQTADPDIRIIWITNQEAQ
jgi:hypothetical protein